MIYVLIYTFVGVLVAFVYALGRKGDKQEIETTSKYDPFIVIACGPAIWVIAFFTLIYWLGEIATEKAKAKK